MRNLYRYDTIRPAIGGFFIITVNRNRAILKIMIFFFILINLNIKCVCINLIEKRM